MLYPRDWPAIAFKTKELAEWTCAACHIRQGDDPRSNITVHHIDYDPFNNHPDNLIVLCQRCHLGRHGLERADLLRQQTRIKAHQAGQLELPGVL